MNLEERIIEYFRHKKRPIGIDQIYADLEIDSTNEEEFENILEDFIDKNLILRDHRDYLGKLSAFRLRLCKIDITAKGLVFAIPQMDEFHLQGKMRDFKIVNERQFSPMNGDIVLVSYDKPDRRGLITGKIVKIVERAIKKIVGTFQEFRSFGIITPDDTSLNIEVEVPSFNPDILKTGMKVVVQILEYPKNHMRAIGEIIEVLGYQNDPGVDILSIMRKYDIFAEFPDEVQIEANNIESAIDIKDHPNRLDLRHLQLVTIDGEDAKDLDDAVFAQKLDNNNIELFVCIADVSHYVKFKSPLDNEAYSRGTSIYLADRVVPMLPTKLSNGICSLNADENRLSLGIKMEIDSNGTVVNYEIIEAIINVYRRLTYKLVNTILDGQDEKTIEANEDILPLINDLHEVFHRLNKRRMNRGSIEFNIPEVKVNLDANGHVVGLKKRIRGAAEKIIEECMLIANETVAEHICRLEYPFLYRNHETPSSDKLDTLRQFLASFNIRLPKNDIIEPSHIQKIIHKVENLPEEKIISAVALRSMQQAKYAENNLGHFGLAAKYYTHFTSPIRRYPDLIVHRLLKAYLHKEKRVFSLYDKLLPEIGIHTSKRERLAIEVERETIRLKEVEYMQQFIGQEFSAIISSVTSFGVFVELDNGIEGLVHINTMKYDEYEFIPEKFTLRGLFSGKIYKLGQEVDVILQSANKDLIRLDFILVDNNIKRSINEIRLSSKNIIADELQSETNILNPEFKEKITNKKTKSKSKNRVSKAILTKVFKPKSSESKPSQKIDMLPKVGLKFSKYEKRKSRLAQKRQDRLKDESFEQNSKKSKLKATNKLNKRKSSSKIKNHRIHEELNDIDSFVADLGSRKHKRAKKSSK